jgi:hypothetical protein
MFDELKRQVARLPRKGDEASEGVSAGASSCSDCLSGTYTSTQGESPSTLAVTMQSAGPNAPVGQTFQLCTM